MALVVTVASASANSYADTDYAAAYFAQTARAADWGSDTTLQEQYLFDAMAMLEIQGWIGSRSTRTQALEWPRVTGGSLWENSTQLASVQWYDLRRRYWTSDAIPTPIKQAQCEMALALKLGFDNAGSGDNSVQSFTADGFSVNFRNSPISAASIPARVSRLLSGLVIGKRLLRA